MSKSKHQRVGLFGHFGAWNFGNESTLQALLCNLRRSVPDAEVTCICSAPEIVAAQYHIATAPIIGFVVKPWAFRDPISRLLRKIFVGIPSELYRWVESVRTLWGNDVLIVVGTGLLTDAFSLAGWGPYSTFKWSVAARLCRCQLSFVSVGVGPLHRRAGRFLVKSSLSLADFRSYRDEATVQYLKGIGFHREEDKVYPDLAYSLPLDLLPQDQPRQGRRPVVGLGLMTHSGMYGVEKTTAEDYAAYLETLAILVKWLLAHDYDIRLLIGDRADVPVTQEFRSLLKQRSSRTKRSALSTNR